MRAFDLVRRGMRPTPPSEHPRSQDANDRAIVLVIKPAPKAGRFLGYVGDELIVSSRQPLLEGARALLACR